MLAAADLSRPGPWRAIAPRRIRSSGSDLYDLAPFDAPNVNRLLWDMQFINIFWGVINLLPVFPLDGGQVSRAIFGKLNPHDGLRQSLIISIVVAVGMAALCLLRWNATFGAFFFGYMAYQSYMLLAKTSGRGFGGRGW